MGWGAADDGHEWAQGSSLAVKQQSTPAQPLMACVAGMRVGGPKHLAAADDMSESLESREHATAWHLCLPRRLAWSWEAVARWT
jgi:hypothetical protein